jgi:hypothetical protein
MNIVIDGEEIETLCGSCGKQLDYEDLVEHPIAIIFDPGENNYPHSPDVPARVWLECWDCALDSYCEIDDIKEMAEDMGLRVIE